jgi:lysine-ketoglutarate reductase/saccharopine dehydrogenase-like protein (TIGR00300 family)
MNYQHPNFDRFSTMPLCSFAPAPADTILPNGFMCTTNFPTYVHTEEGWLLADQPRMDAHLIWDSQEKKVYTKEFRTIKKGELVAIASVEDGTEGVLVWEKGFASEEEESEEAFGFMRSDVSREKPINYSSILQEFRKNRRDEGYIIWVIGPALVHARGREAMEWMIHNGYAHAILTGNAVAVHDVEAALFGSTLGMKADGSGAAGGHSCHMRAINRVKQAGSIQNLVAEGTLKTGIMHALSTNDVPFVLAGSIRDDGPLPETITDALTAQGAMREHTQKATMVVMVATALHSIAVGNMLPTFCTRPDGSFDELTTICVDQTEFLVSKLKDRGTHQAFGIVTNAQDFMRLLQIELQE